METRYTDQTGLVLHHLQAYNVTLKKNISVWGHGTWESGTFRHVGPWYKTKAEALADLDSYMVRAGWVAHALD